MRNRPEEVSTNEIQPWHSLGGIEHICELRKSCMVLYGIFTELARLVYHDTDGRLKGVPSVKWSRNGTSIWIDSELRWEDEHPEVRPAIYVQLGQLQTASFIPRSNAQITAADRFGVRNYAHRTTGNVTFMHVAQTVGEACALADNTEYAISSLQDVICDDFCFSRLELLGRAPLEKLPKEAKDMYASGVTFEFEFISEWAVKQECPILKAIDLIEDECVDDPFDKQTSKISKSYRHKTISSDNIVTEKETLGTPK